MSDETAPVACELCGDTSAAMFLVSRCHPSAPLRVIKDGDVLILRCYVPECNREVVRLRLAVPEGRQGLA